MKLFLYAMLLILAIQVLNQNRWLIWGAGGLVLWSLDWHIPGGIMMFYALTGLVNFIWWRL